MAKGQGSLGRVNAQPQRQSRIAHHREQRGEWRAARQLEFGHERGGSLRCLPDGRWFDAKAATWRDRRGRPARWPDLMEVTRLRMTRYIDKSMPASKLTVPLRLYS